MSTAVDSSGRTRRLHAFGLALLAAMLLIAAAPIDAQVPEPSFTPMTVLPQLTNFSEVQQALMAAYPPALRDAGVEGAPVMWLYIGTDGTVQATRIQESSEIPALDEAAQQVARAMRFTPARNRDEIVAVWVQIPIRFRVVR